MSPQSPIESAGRPIIIPVTIRFAISRRCYNRYTMILVFKFSSICPWLRAICHCNIHVIIILIISHITQKIRQKRWFVVRWKRTYPGGLWCSRYPQHSLVTEMWNIKHKKKTIDEQWKAIITTLSVNPNVF